MMTFDPGKGSFGWAVFDGKNLTGCGYVENKFKLLGIEAWNVTIEYVPDQVVIEVPQIYEQRKWKGDPNDLIDVALSAGAIGNNLIKDYPIEFVKPHAWKGSRPKAVCNKLTQTLLEPWERDTLNGCQVPKGKRHNVIDAIGIGLWKLGRR